MDYAKASAFNQVGHGAANALAPKELGIIQRVDGINSGLKELRQRLEIFSDRLDATGRPGTDQTESCAIGLNGTLTDAEGELRTCLHLVNTLHDRF